MFEEEMRYEGVREFYNKRERIREIYEGLSYGMKFVYKSYVYSRDMWYKQRDIIWEYLNEPKDSEYFIRAKLEMISFKRGKK